MDPAAARAGLMKLAPVVKTNEGGGAQDSRQAKAWRARRKTVDDATAPLLPKPQSPLMFRPPMSPEMSARVLNLTRPSTEPGKRREKPPVALSVLKKNSTELFRVWNEDPKRDGRPAPLEAAKKSVGRRGRRPNTADDLLKEHSRLLFRPVDDKRRQIGSLPLRERLFLFYKRFARKMLVSVSEIAEYWKDDEPVFENLLASKYGTTLAEEGFGRTEAAFLQMQDLQQEMRECRVEMSPEVRPRDEWIPQNARPVCPLALRDAFLLSEAHASAPVWELDEKVREMFMRPHTAATNASQDPEPGPRPQTPDEDESVLHKVALSLNQQVVTWQPHRSRPGSVGSVGLAKTPSLTLSAEQSRLPTPAQIRPHSGIIQPTAGTLSPAASPEHPKDAWREVESSSHGKKYWYNASSGESRWLPPMSSNILVLETRPSTPQGIDGSEPGQEQSSGVDGEWVSPRLAEPQGDAELYTSLLPSTKQVLPSSVGSWRGKEHENAPEAPPAAAVTEPMSATKTEELVKLPEPVSATKTEEAVTRPEPRRGMMLHRNFLPSSMNNVLAPQETRGERKVRKEKKNAETARLTPYAVKIQACARGWLLRKHRREASAKVRRTMEGVMAAKIQSWWLGWLHHKQTRQRRLQMKASGFTIYMAHEGVVKAGRMWLSRTRAKVLEQKRLAAAIKIQKHFRGMMVVRSIRRQQHEKLEKAALRVQRAWRRQREWQIFVATEEKRAIAEASRLRKQYLYAGKTAKQAKALRVTAEDKFEAATTDLGRTKAEAKLDVAHGRAAAEISSFGMWMATLRALVKHDDPGETRPVSAGAPSPGPPAGGVKGAKPAQSRGQARRLSQESVASGEGEQTPVKGIKDILAYSKLTNPPEVDNAIGEQRHEGGRKLQLLGMKLLRWPFGVSDKTKGGHPWFSLRSVWVSNNLLPGLPEDFYVLTNLTELRLDRNRIETLSPKVGNLTGLTSLWLHSNLLKAVPKEIGACTRLTFMSLYENKLKALPFEVCQLRDLRKLPCYANPDCRSPPLQLVERSKTTQGLVDIMRFTSRFMSAFAPPHLLNIGGFGLSFVPEINRVPVAQAIDMSSNLLPELRSEAFVDPKHLVQWHKQLTALNVADNKLTEFPMAVVLVTTLKHLDLRNNAIPTIPADITAMHKLLELRFDGNPLTSPTFSVLADGVETFEVSGCAWNPAANGLYYKSDDEHDGTHVFELRKTCLRDEVAEAERLRLFYCDSGWRQGWYIGAELAVAGALLNVNDNAARPSAISSVWKERSSEGLLFRADKVRVKGLGLTEYMARLLALKESKAEVSYMQEQFKVSEMLYSSTSANADASEAIERRRALHNDILQKRAAMTLDMSHLALSTLPAQIADVAVKHLILDGNRLEHVAPGIVEMPLASLSMRLNALSAIPACLRRLTALQSLCLERNCLADLPDQLSALHSLKTLLVSANLLQRVPAPVEHMTALRLLDLTHNYIEFLPSGLSSLLDLQDLRLRMNRLTTLNGFIEKPAGWRPSVHCPIASMVGLTSLDVDANQLESIPPSLRALTLLSAICLGRNRVEDLSDLAATVRAWVHLQSWDMEHNSLKELPPRLDSLAQLARIDLASNGLSVFPPGVASLPALRSLSLARNFLKWLPSEVGRLTCLTHLDASHNLIAHVAADVRLCSALVSLDLSHNNIARLPPQIGHVLSVFGRLWSLASLDLRHNQLVTLPTDLLQCSSLTSLEASGNAFTHHAILRALQPSIPVGVLRITIHEAAEIRGATRSARGNPFCVVSTHRRAEEEQSTNSIGEVYGEQHETSTKHMTDSPVWEETVWVELASLEDTVSVAMHDRKNTGKTAELGYACLLPAAFAVLDNIPFLHPLGDPALIALARSAKQLVLADGQDLASQGDDFKALVVVVRGRLAVLQRNEDGVERVVGEVGAGGCAGESCLVEGEALQHSLQAVAPSLLLVLPSSSLSPILARDCEHLIPLILWTQTQKGRDKVYAEQPPTKGAESRAASASAVRQRRRGSVVVAAVPGQASTQAPKKDEGGKKSVAWGSKEWEQNRESELEELRACLAAACTAHRLENNALRQAVGVLEKRAKAKMDAGGVVYACTPSPPPPQTERSHTLALTAPTAPHRHGAREPHVVATVGFKAGSTVTPHFQALRAVEREGGDDGLRRPKAKHMDKVRNTPSGLVFDTEQDELKADDQVRRVEEDMKELDVYKRTFRNQAVWEAAPRMYVLGGVFPKDPWDGAGDRNRHQAINTFSGMAELLDVMYTERQRPATDPRPKHADLSTARSTAPGVWKQVEAAIDATRRQRSALGDGTGGTYDKPASPRKRVYRTKVDAWAMVVGLLLSKPEWIRHKEASRPEMELQDWQFAMVRDQQEIASLREKAKWMKKKMVATLEEMEDVRARMKSAETALQVEWNGEAFAAYKAAKGELELMQARFDLQRQAKERAKTLNQTRRQSGVALQWRSDAAMNKVLDTFRAQKDEILDPIGALANVVGGEIERDVLDAIERVDFVIEAHRMTPAEVAAWARGDAVLKQSARIQEQVVGVLERFGIDGRMLMHLDKDDLLRMGLLGPDARVALVAAAGLKKRLRMETAKSRAQATRFKLNMRVALLDPDVRAIDALLGEELELEQKQLLGLRKAFMKQDWERKGEILWKEAVKAAAALGMEANERRLEELKTTLEPSEALSLDLVGFCRFGKGLLSSSQATK